MNKLREYFWPVTLSAYGIGLLFSAGYLLTELTEGALSGLKEMLPNVIVLVV